MSVAEAVNHPAHYGGADNPYEAIKVIEAWELGFCLGNTVKYICRHGKKVSDEEREECTRPELDAMIRDLEKARWYLDRHIKRLKEIP